MRFTAAIDEAQAGLADASPKPFDAKLKVGSEFTIKVFRSPVAKPTFFTAGGNSDEQSDGWFVS